MNEQEHFYWDLFTATGEPLYYSMYVRERDRASRKHKDTD